MEQESDSWEGAVPSVGGRTVGAIEGKQDRVDGRGGGREANEAASKSLSWRRWDEH